MNGMMYPPMDFENFLDRFDQCDNLIDSLHEIHKFINDECTDDNRLENIVKLIHTFTSRSYHPSVLKTVLVISKPVKNNPLVKESRMRLLETYESMMED